MKHGFLFWVSLLFVSVVMASFTISSNCFALSYEEIETYINATADLYPNNEYYQGFKRIINYSYTEDFFNNQTSNLSNKTYMYLDKEGSASDNYMSMYVYTTPNEIRVDSDSISMFGSTGIRYRTDGSRWWVVTSGSMSIIPTLAYSTTANNYNNLQGMLYTPQPIESVYTTPLTYVGNQALSRYEKLEFVNSMENAAYNNNLYTYYYQGDFYSNNQIKLGDVISNDSYYFEIRLRDSKSSNIKGTCFVALNTSPYTIYNDGAIYINDSFEVYAVPRLLSYSNQYQLEIESYYGDGGNDNLEEDIDWFIFLPNNAVVSGDVITSLGSGDFTQQDNTNTMIGFLNNNAAPSGDLQAILGTSGNILSGDLFKDIKMPEVDGMNRTTLFDLLYAIAGTIGEEGDAYFDFQMHGETPTRVYASQFTTPNGPLKTFISSFLVFFTFYFLLLQIRHAIEMLSTANIKGTLEYVDASLDNMFYM